MKTWCAAKSPFVVVTALLCMAVATAGWFFTGYLVELATQAVKKNVADANTIISLHLVNELKRIEGAAVAVSGSPLTLPVLQSRNQENIDKANNILDRYHKSLDAAACYLIDSSGVTITSSNRHAKDSFVGQNYTFRSYFQQAMKGAVGRYFAFGTVSQRRGFFASAPVKDKEGRIVGVVAIKKELDDIETKLNQYIWFLIDRDGIIFLSSLPEARLKSLWPLDEGTKKRIVQSKQYGPGPFDPMLSNRITAGSEVAFKGKAFVTAQQGTPYEDISVILFWPMRDVEMSRNFGIALTALSVLIFLGFMLTLHIFQRSLRERGQAARELKVYADQLQAGVDLKTQTSRIAAELQKAETLEGLAQTFMYHTAPLAGIVYGAFYIMDEADGLLKPVGGYGSMNDSGGFAVGQGLVGQCAWEKAPIDIIDPRQIPIRISWGGGQLEPRELLLLPVLQLEKALGVIELAAMAPFSTEQRLLLAELTAIVALNIEILNRNMRTKELLAESRTQAEALAVSERQLLARQQELEEQRETLLSQRLELEESREMLVKAEKRSRTILDAISVGTIIIDPATRVIADVNPIAARMIGLPPQEIIGCVCHEFVCPSAQDKCPLLDLKQEVDNAERNLLTSGGGSLPILKTVSRVQLGDKEYLLESFVDISAQKAMESELKVRMDELERFTKLTIDREEKMIELKKEINELLVRMGQEAKYTIVD